MVEQQASPDLKELLKKAVAREVQVSVQYMLQHGVGAGKAAAGIGDPGKADRFVATHAQVWLPGASLKKTAITEMRHAEAIVERLVHLGERPPVGMPVPDLGETTGDMLGRDVKAEEEAIELYTRIIELAHRQGDRTTEALFTRILGEERQHLSTFTRMLSGG